MIIQNGKTFQELGAKDAFLKLGNRSRIIGIGVANIVNILDPDIVILGGGGGLSKNVKLKTVQSVADKHIIHSIGGKTLIVKGKLGEFAQAIGAALLFKKR
jgi:glucokinase